jgi:hypothetical protein
MLLCLRLSTPRRNHPTGSALERVAKEFDRICTDRLRNCDEFGHIYPPLERFDALNPVRRLPKLLGKLPLGKTSRIACLAKRGDYGPLAGGIFHDTPGNLAEVLLIPYHPY